MPYQCVYCLIGVFEHLVFGAVLDGMGYKNTRRGEAQSPRLRFSSVNEAKAGHEYSGDSRCFQIGDVVHTARRATASIRQRFNDSIAR